MGCLFFFFSLVGIALSYRDMFDRSLYFFFFQSYLCNLMITIIRVKLQDGTVTDAILFFFPWFCLLSPCLSPLASSMLDALRNYESEWWRTMKAIEVSLNFGSSLLSLSSWNIITLLLILVGLGRFIFYFFPAKKKHFNKQL